MPSDKPTSSDASAQQRRLWGAIARGEDLSDPNRGAGQSEQQRIFSYLGPEELSQPAKPVEFAIKNALPRDSWGNNSAPKKSLKTHLNQAMGLSVASGISLFKSDYFKVPQTESVLFLIGEGGQESWKRTLQRTSTSYGVDVRDLPLHALFGSAPLNSPEFRDEVKEQMDRMQPGLVILESVYNFHPSDVETGILHKRGAVLADYHNFIRREAPGCISILTDHFRSTNNGLLDLDTIGGAGQAENSDCWILGGHRHKPDLLRGDFKMRTHFGSRQTSGRTYDIDWHLGMFDADVGEHIGDIEWEVSPSDGEDQIGLAAPKESARSNMAERIMEFVDNHPFEFTRSDIETQVKGRRKDVAEKLAELLDSPLLTTRDVEGRGRDGRRVTSSRVGRGDGPLIRRPEAGTEEDG